MLQQSLSNLIYGVLANTRGVCALIGVPKDWVQSMPDEKTLLAGIYAPGNCDFVMEDIILKPGKEWLNLSEGLNINIDFSEEQNWSAQGDAFAYEIPITIPHDDFTTRGKVFRAYLNHEWILIPKERTGAWRVVGSLAAGARFTRAFRSGTVKSASSKHIAGFAWTVGGRLAYYTKLFDQAEFLSGSYWFRLNGTSETAQFRIVIHESVVINWGDDVLVYYPTPGDGSLSEILHEAVTDGDNIAITVYHRKLSDHLDVSGGGTDSYNNTITEITGTLSPYLKKLNLAKNQIQFNPLGAGTPHLQHAKLDNNRMDADSLEAALEQLDTDGNENGYLDLQSQSPPVTPTGGMLAFIASLEAKGWTIAY